MSSIRVAVAGASGYAGGELLRLLLAHPLVEIGALTAGSNAGERLGSLQPHLSPLADRVLAGHHGRDPDGPRRRLPGTAARSVRRRSPPTSPTTRSSSTAGPTSGCATRQQWAEFYGGPHAGSWPYGLPELPGAARRTARRAPGRRPRVLPDGVDAWRSRPRSRRVWSRRTSSWSRPRARAARARRSSRTCSGSEVMGNASAYGVGGVHRHTPEIVQNLAALTEHEVRVSFTPVLVPMPRGILATCSAPLTPGVIADRGPRDLPQGVRRRALRARPAGGGVAADQGRPRQQCLPAPGDRRRERRSRSSSSARSTTSPRAPPGEPSSP